MADPLLDQKLRIAHLRNAFMKAIDGAGERDISIIFAALIELASRVSDWNLEAERKQMVKNDSEPPTTVDVEA